jgi:D-3-phosphoglycerate dehydrogenase
MEPFKVVLIETDGGPTPDWVPPTLAEAGIDFAQAECRTADELAECAGDADLVWLWGSQLIDAAMLDRLPRCGAIVRTGSGTDNVPVAAATARGIVVANTPSAHNDAVSDHAIGLLFALMRGIPLHDRTLRAGQWRRNRLPRAWHLRGQALGLVGFGLIARAVAHKLSGFDLTVRAYDPFVSADAMTAAGVTPATLDEVLAQSDFVFLHCPLTPQTHHLIDARALKLLKPEALLINTARGPVVDEAAVIAALQAGELAGFGTDVFEQEPPDMDNPLLKMDNVVATPHVAGQSDEDRNLCFRLAVDSILALRQGRYPLSYVNRSVQPRWTLA